MTAFIRAVPAAALGHTVFLECGDSVTGPGPLASRLVPCAADPAPETACAKHGPTRVKCVVISNGLFFAPQPEKDKT